MSTNCVAVTGMDKRNTVVNNAMQSFPMQQKRKTLGLSWAVLLMLSLRVFLEVAVSYDCGLEVWCHVASFDMMLQSPGLSLMTSHRVAQNLYMAVQIAKMKQTLQSLFSAWAPKSQIVPSPALYLSMQSQTKFKGNLLMGGSHVRGGVVWDCLWRLS